MFLWTFRAFQYFFQIAGARLNFFTIFLIEIFDQKKKRTRQNFQKQIYMKNFQQKFQNNQAHVQNFQNNSSGHPNGTVNEY